MTTGGLGYVLKSDDEKRYALGVLYSPGVADAHNEYIGADELQEAVWKYLHAGDLRLRKQHDRGQVIGMVVEILTLPWAITADATVGKTRKKLKLPAGTVLVGAVFSEEAWPLVKSGKLNGWSLGGRAKRVPTNTVLPPAADPPGKYATVKSAGTTTLAEKVRALLDEA
jgi:hypothetical protein